MAAVYTTGTGLLGLLAGGAGVGARPLTTAELAVIWLAVAAAGAACRYALDFAITARSRERFPWGTLVVKVSGALRSA